MAAAIGGISGQAFALGGKKGEGAPLCVAASRSAVVRLAPVAAQLHASKPWPIVAGMIDGLGQHAAPRTLECFQRTATEVAADVEAAMARSRPSMLLIADESDATVLSALAAARAEVPIVRIGAGLRCGDRAMTEEVNRVVLDAMAERLYADSDAAVRTLLEEGVPEQRVRRVGSTLPDVVFRWREHARERALWRRLGLPPTAYVLVTLHRDENLADDARLDSIVEALSRLAERAALVLCLHPHTRTRLEASGGLHRLAAAGAIFTGPLGYIDFLSLQATAGAVVTDSAGVQEETTILGVRCYTFRRTTERALTLTYGTNILLGDDPEDLDCVIVDGPLEDAQQPIPGWDGAASRRVAADLRLRVS
jgi:UDP-N-acetylglucosamine 2-epimerase (non-hydrolysing)